MPNRLGDGRNGDRSIFGRSTFVPSPRFGLKMDLSPFPNELCAPQAARRRADSPNRACASQSATLYAHAASSGLMAGEGRSTMCKRMMFVEITRLRIVLAWNRQRRHEKDS